MFTLQHIDHIAFQVRDVERSAQWYQEVLGLERHQHDAWTIPVELCLGNTCLALFPMNSTQARTPEASHYFANWHLAFRANRANFEEAKAELERRGIEVHFEDHRISHSIYFNDPDGCRLEITTYEV